MAYPFFFSLPLSIATINRMVSVIPWVWCYEEIITKVYKLGSRLSGP